MTIKDIKVGEIYRFYYYDKEYYYLNKITEVTEDYFSFIEIYYTGDSERENVDYPKERYDSYTYDCVTIVLDKAYNTPLWKVMHGKS